jgi:hypothetical protein
MFAQNPFSGRAGKGANRARACEYDRLILLGYCRRSFPLVILYPFCEAWQVSLPLS